jgi:hypothetical protein
MMSVLCYTSVSTTDAAYKEDQSGIKIFQSKI